MSVLSIGTKVKGSNDNNDVFFFSLILTSWIKEVDCVNAGVDIVTLTSLNEGTPTSLIESQAANKPIVANRVGGVADIVLEGKTALLAERDNLEDFVSKMLQLIEDDDLRSKMSQEGASFAKKRFDFVESRKRCKNK